MASLADLLNSEPQPLNFSQPSEVNSRMGFALVAPSTNIDDRRRSGISLADLAQQAWMAINDSKNTGESRAPWHATNPNFPSGKYSSDINNAVDGIKLARIMELMGQNSDAKARMNAYFDSGNPAAAAPVPVLYKP